MMNLSLQDIKSVIDERVLGKITPQHTEEGHFYRFEDTGRIVPSVTTILKEVLAKPHLLNWAVKKGIEWLEVDDRWTRIKDPAYRDEYITGAQIAHTEFRDSAGSIGTQAHQMCEDYIKEWLKTGNKPENMNWFAPNGTDNKAIAAARGFEKLTMEHQIIPLASEILVGHQKYSAGTLDFLCMWDNKLTLVDFKTSNSVTGKDFLMQIGAYTYFFNYMTDLKIKQVKLVHFSKEMDKPTVYKLTKPYAAYTSFKSLASFHKWWTNDKFKLEKDIKKIII